MKTTPTAAAFAGTISILLSACAPRAAAPEPPRPVRTVEISYGQAVEAHRYAGTVHARHEVDQAFRVGGKVKQRLIEVGQRVEEGAVVAVLDDTDYRLAEEAASQRLIAAQARASQAQSDRHRLDALKSDGSVSPSDDERAESGAVQSQAAAAAESRELEVARDRLRYTVLRTSQAGVITAVKFEVGQVVAEGQAIVTVANESEPEIVIDVPEDELDSFQRSHFTASLSSAAGETFPVTLRELAPQATAQTRTYRARLKPTTPREIPLGATATLIAEHPLGDTSAAVIPASAITQSDGHAAVWVVHPSATHHAGAVALEQVTVQGYRNDQVLISGPAAGTLIVTAGVQKMAPGLQVALTDTGSEKPILEASR